MAPLPPESTPRLYVDYNNIHAAHTLVFRYDPAAPLSAVQAFAHNFLTELAPIMYAITIDGARFSLAGTNVSNPITWTGDASYGTGLQPEVQAPFEIRFQGRGASGRKVSWSLYGCSLAAPATYRWPAGTIPELDAAITVLRNAAGAGTFITIAGDQPLIKGYVNANFNSYWEQEARG
jgi:hypothetical protein